MSMGIAMATKRRRNRLVTAREPSGRIQRESDTAPGEIRRLRDAALRGLRDPEWGTELGRLFLEQAITSAMYAAGKKWAEAASDYRQAIGVFPARSASLQRGSRGMPPDPDSDEGKIIVSREANGAERFFAAHSALVFAGMMAENAVRLVVEEDLALCGWVQRQALVKGLTALAEHYGLTVQGKSRNMSNRQGE